MIGTGAWRVGAATVLLSAVLAVAGCGDQESAEPTSGTTASDSSREPTGQKSSDQETTAEAAPPGAPDCSQVWREGSRLPRSYQGCVDGSGGYVRRDSLACSSGQRMIRYADRFYGVLGGTVHEVARSLDRAPDYRDAVSSCRA